MNEALKVGVAVAIAILIVVLISRKKSKSKKQMSLKEVARRKCWKTFHLTLAPFYMFFVVLGAVTFALNVHRGSYSRDFFEIIIVLSGLASFWLLCLMSFYSKEVFANKELEKEKTMWIMGVYFLQIPFMIYYWWRFFYKPYKNMN